VNPIFRVALLFIVCYYLPFVIIWVQN